MELPSHGAPLAQSRCSPGRAQGHGRVMALSGPYAARCPARRRPAEIIGCTAFPSWSSVSHVRVRRV